MRETIKQLNAKNPLIFNLSLLFLLSVVIVLPAYFGGIPGGVDMPQHFQFAQTFYESVKNGEFYPSWSAQPNYGYGDVGVRFYPPLTYYLLMVFRGLVGNWFDAACLLVAFLFFVSGVGVYLWSREWFSDKASLTAAAAYIILPYHVNQFYGASLYAEFTAGAILPFCFLFATRVCQKGRLADVLGLAIAFGLLILSHLPTTVMASLLLVIYTLFSLTKTNFIQTLGKLAVSVSMSLLLSGFYWVRMVWELDFVKHTGEMFISDAYSFKSHFAFLNYFPFIETEVAKTASFVDLTLFLTLGVGVAFGILYFRQAKQDKRFSLKPILAMTISALVMATPLSLKIWEFVPLLQKIQFPWRWIIFISLGVSLVIGAGFSGAVEYLKTQQRYLSILAVGLLLLCFPYNYFRVMILLFNYPKEHFNPVVEKLKSSPSNECWWTAWARKSSDEKAFTLPRPEFIAEKIVLNDRQFEIKSWSSTDRIFTLEAGASGQVEIATLYYPHWKAEVNGQTVEVSPSRIGLISFPVGAEKAEVKVYFAEPNFVKTAYFLSAFGWLLMVLFFAFRRFRFKSL
jgi:uncharacterized membrane protein YhdT